MVDRFSIIIIGSGPAGVATALNLYRQNPNLARETLLLEKAVHPREKICGGGLSGNTEMLLEELGIELSIPFVPINHLRLNNGHGAIDLPQGCFNKIVRRSQFDSMLADEVRKKKISLNEREPAIKVERCGDDVIVTTARETYRARVVVGADGVYSMLRNVEGFVKRNSLARLFEIDIPADPQQSIQFQQYVGMVDLSLVSKGMKGYIWELPCYIDGKPFLNIGIMDSNLERKTRVDLKAVFRDALKKRGIDLSQYRLKGHPERPFSPNDVFAIQNMLLVGDAAGIDSCFGEGISQSLEYGKIAAEAIARAFEDHDFSFASYRSEIFKQRLGKEQEMYRFMARLFYGPRWRFWLSFLWNSRVVQTLLAESYGGKRALHKQKLKIAFLAFYHFFFHYGKSLRIVNSRTEKGDHNEPEAGGLGSLRQKGVNSNV